MLPLSYLLCSIICVAMLAALGADRRFRSVILVPLTILVTVVAWQFAGDYSGALPGTGGKIAWAWFPLAAAWLLAIFGGAASRLLPIAVLLLCGLVAFGFETELTGAAGPLATPTSADTGAQTGTGSLTGVVTAIALAVHRTLAVGLAAVALAALASLCVRFPEGDERERWRFLSALACGMFGVFVLALALIFFLQREPLNLDLRIALTVLPAETIAAFCVYRGVHTVATGGSNDGDDSSGQSGRGVGAVQGTAILVLFVLAGGGLGLVPVILSGAARLIE